MRLPGSSRRTFLRSSALCTGALWPSLRAACQTTAATARLNVAEAVRDRVLERVKGALTAPITTLADSPPPYGDANRFVSETDRPSGVAVAASAVPSFRAHALALRKTSNVIACLSAAYVLEKNAAYAQRAGAHLRAWFLDAKKRMSPEASLAGCEPGSLSVAAKAASDTNNAHAVKGTPAGIVDLVPLAELARATSFLVDSETLTTEEWTAIGQWFTELATWLNTDRTAGLARDTKDHRASAWLLINAAIARSQRDDKLLEACRKRFRAPTLRNQITADGRFPQEVATPEPFRNTLFNFDLLTGACQLLASPFDLLWDYELQDGPGMRAVAAFVFPSIADPTKWAYVADLAHFRDLPGPRPGLLFAGRAYNRPEYTELWRSLDPLEVPEAIGGSFPIREPLLWTARAAHGL